MERMQEICDRMTAAVAAAAGCTEAELMGGRSSRAVTARAALVDALLAAGFDETAAAEATGMSRQRVNSLKNAGRWRLKTLEGRIIREELAGKSFY